MAVLTPIGGNRDAMLAPSRFLDEPSPRTFFQHLWGAEMRPGEMGLRGGTGPVPALLLSYLAGVAVRAGLPPAPTLVPGGPARLLTLSYRGMYRGMGTAARARPGPG